MLTRVLSEARRPMAFLGQARRHSVDVETSPRGGKPRLSLSWMLILVARVPPGTLATRAPETPLTRSPWKSWWPGSRWRLPALSLLGTWDSVVPSFLPQTQSQRRQLAGYGHAQDGRIDSLLEAGVIIILKRSRLADGAQGRRLENLFQLGPMVGVEPARLQGLGAADGAPCRQAILAAAAINHSQADVGPETCAAAKAVGSLHVGHQQGHAQRPHPRDLAQARRHRVLAGLGQRHPKPTRPTLRGREPKAGPGHRAQTRADDWPHPGRIMPVGKA